MPQCVRVLPKGLAVGSVPPNTIVFSNHALLVVDDSCTSGLQVFTKDEIDRLFRPPVDTERVLDMTELFYAFVLVCVTVWGVKQLLNLFTGDTSRD